MDDGTSGPAGGEVLAAQIEAILPALDPALRDVIRVRSGLVPSVPLTTAEVAERYGVTVDAVREAEAKVLAALRRPGGSA